MSVRNASEYALFVLSFTIRLIYYRFHTKFTTFESIVGVPFTDARFWNEIAISISQGQGLSGPNRPFYPIFLSLFYTWFPSSFFLPKILNIFVNSLTVSFLYLIGGKVFNKSVGLGASFLAMIHLEYLKSNLTIMTEPFGLFLFVLSCFFMISGLMKKSMVLLFCTGVLFSLCNLTRTMTLVAFPGYLLIMLYVLKTQNVSYRKSLLLLSLFSIGVFATLSPWLVRQKAVYGVFSISPNSANLIYTATSPRYKQWNGGEVEEAVEKGFKTHKDQYHYFIKGAWENVLKYPFFYLRNISSSLFQFVTCYHFRWVPLYKKYHVILFCIGIILSLIHHNCYVLILVNSAVSVAIGSAMVANAGVPLRLFTMVHWLFDLFSLYAICCVIRTIPFKSQDGKRFSFLPPRLNSDDYLCKAKPIHLEERLNKSLKVMSGILILFLVVSVARITYLNLFAVQPLGMVLRLNPQEKIRILEEINKRLPGTFTQDELTQKERITEPVNEFVNDPSDLRDHGRIVVHLNKIDRYQYYLRKEEKIHDWFRLFTPRGYHRTIFSMGNWAWVFYIFPGKIPKAMKGKYVISVGKLNIDMRFGHEARRIVEVIALIPYGRRPEMENMILANNEQHWRRWNSLTH